MKTIDDRLFNAPSGLGVAVAVNTFMSIKLTRFKHTVAFHHSHVAVFQDLSFRYFSDLSQNYKNKTQTATLPGWLLLGLPLLPPGTHTCCEHSRAAQFWLVRTEMNGSSEDPPWPSGGSEWRGATERTLCPVSCCVSSGWWTLPSPEAAQLYCCYHPHTH